MALLPIAIAPHGTFGSLFQRFLYGTDAAPSPPFRDDRPNAKKADRLARSSKVPRALLPRANDFWRKENPDMNYGDSYKTTDPTIYFEHEAGLIISTAVSSHILRAHNKNGHLKPIRCGIDKECKCTEDNHPMPEDDTTLPPTTFLPITTLNHPLPSRTPARNPISGSVCTFLPTDPTASADT
eukprot:CAMPEP_0183742432 /NCGR_PEP_ID=MMETSP0737-20130205/64693_1 /TAXON_ID=385413 /ORGANISM="Thalassiosira miniscula, Strain CCMP1093" /LENGTH=182 /DNA_ID=CAMNT_0025978017 /DNA_START=422 /DNA_END=970 /DNA_ORIENTATION=+